MKTILRNLSCSAAIALTLVIGNLCINADIPDPEITIPDCKVEDIRNCEEIFGQSKDCPLATTGFELVDGVIIEVGSCAHGGQIIFDYQDIRQFEAAFEWEPSAKQSIWNSFPVPCGLVWDCEPVLDGPFWHCQSQAPVGVFATEYVLAVPCN